MVRQELQEAVAALSPDERLELIEYIERTMADDIPPPDEATIAMLRARVAEMEADPSRAQSKEEHLAAVRAMLA